MENRNYSESIHRGLENEGLARLTGAHRYSESNRRSGESDPSSAWLDFCEAVSGMLSQHQSGRYGHRHEESGYDRLLGRYRGQPRTSTGRFRRADTHHLDAIKEEISADLAEAWDMPQIAKRAVREAAELIEALERGEDFEAVKEFAELCILMKAVMEEISPEVVEEAECEAIEYWEKKVSQGKSRIGREEDSEEMRRMHHRR